MKQQLIQSKRLVIKVGSSLLVDEDGTLHREWLDNFCDDIARLYQRGQQVILVSSGAVALGRRHLCLKRQKLQLEEQQAAAATGQIRLSYAYQDTLARHDISVAQILLTLNDSENRKRYLNARNTLETLLRMQVVPIINENDTVATSERRYGDNDRLSARVAQMVGADTLVLLSDIDGLYDADPKTNPQAKLITEVTDMTPEIFTMAGDSAGQYGSGGMKTKLVAAQIVMASGCRMVICDGRVMHPLRALEENARCTWFIPQTTPKRARKNWLAQHLQPQGSLIIDEGAAHALRQGKSLLSVGVTEVEGYFQKGDLVRILTQEKEEVGRGLCNYPLNEARRIIRHKSSEIEDILGYCGSATIIHRDNLVVFGNKE